VTVDAQRGNFDALPAELIYDGVTRRSFSSDQATVTSYTFTAGATFPRHRHAQEQITLIQAGEVEMTIGHRVERLSSGEWWVVAPDVEHGITAGPTGATVMAIVIPRRESADAYTVVG
jgi:quercetin dioxygenase-like cupin family protein